MTDKMVQVWKKGELVKVGLMYADLTRNPDPEVRAKFKTDREILGTKAWAIAKCMTLSNPATSFDDTTCDLIIAGLDA